MTGSHLLKRSVSLRDRIGLVLERTGNGHADAIVAIAPLTGGVSSDVFKVRAGNRELCVKFAVEQLRVAGDWRAPLRRSAAEFEWLSFVAEHFPGYVPDVFGHDADQHGIVMAYLPESAHRNWKRELLDGRVHPPFAAAVGSRLAEVHAASAGQPAIPARFANGEDFEALRIDPYLRATGVHYPLLADRFDTLADELGATRIALVHGDISPKNILCGPDGPVFIDAECATFGDPAFDVAFVLNHLAIKAIIRPRDRVALNEAAAQLWASYRACISWEPPGALERRAAHLLPALMLARVDGKSPLEYLTPKTADHVRVCAISLFAAELSEMPALLRSATAGGMQ